MCKTKKHPISERERERGSTRSSKIERETLTIMWWCRPGFNLALPCLFLCRVYLVVKFSYPSQYNPVIYNIILLNIKFNNVHTLIALISNSDFIRYLSVYGPHFHFSICLDRWKLIAYAFHLFFFFFLGAHSITFERFQWVLYTVHKIYKLFFFSKTFNKNGSNDTIYTFENYFITIFLIFSKISIIQTDR